MNPTYRLDAREAIMMNRHRIVQNPLAFHGRAEVGYRKGSAGTATETDGGSLGDGNRDAIGLPRSLGSKLPSILIASSLPL